MILSEVYELDEFGFLKEVYVAELDSSGIIIDEDKKHMIPVQYSGLFKPKWIVSEWVEGATQEEIDEINKVEPSPPTEIELLAQSVSEREIVEITQGQQISDLEIRLMNGGL